MTQQHGIYCSTEDDEISQWQNKKLEGDLYSYLYFSCTTHSTVNQVVHAAVRCVFCRNKFSMHLAWRYTKSSCTHRKSDCHYHGDGIVEDCSSRTSVHGTVPAVAWWHSCIGPIVVMLTKNLHTAICVTETTKSLKKPDPCCISTVS